ncbi:peptidase family M48-domain-containing protein [Russula earlei]|uniref:Peptidase family M48-domain-containing protein n=1 Tax=Russula earlei TaxID=71964 RepID=A0ACC0UMA2_9AGAM|nr:peptidase family M48-domain-containing protein [Russula earlei]
MHLTRAYTPFLQAVLRGPTCHRHSIRSNLVRHFERKHLLLASHRNLSISTPRRAQYSRFDDNPNRPRPPTGLQKRDVIIYTLGVGSIVYYIFHLEQVPETGRWRFMDVSARFEASLWEASYTDLSNQFLGKLLPPSHVITQQVHRIVSRILEANDLGTLRGDQRTPPPTRAVPQPSFGFTDGGGDEGPPDLWDPDATGHGAVSGTASRREWNLLVVNDEKVVNAMAAPGVLAHSESFNDASVILATSDEAPIVVFTGILPVARDEQGLAAILGHEIGHVVARHAAERYSYSKVLIALAWLADLIGLPFGVGEIMTTLLMELPHSRKQEYEADKIGLNLSARACFDPTAAPEMFKRLGSLERSGGGLNVSFLNTHPASDERVKQLQALLPEAFTVRASACGGMSDYLGDFGDAAGLGRGVRSPLL